MRMCWVNNIDQENLDWLMQKNKNKPKTTFSSEIQMQLFLSFYLNNE